MTNLKKFANEPLVWVAAVVLCIPMFGQGLLNGIKNAVFFESASTAENLIDPGVDSLGSSLPPIDPIAESTEAAEGSADYVSTNVQPFTAPTDPPSNRLAEAPRIEPEPVLSDPGSLELEVLALQQPADQQPAEKQEPSKPDESNSKSEQAQEQELDFLFGEEPELEKDVKDADKPIQNRETPTESSTMAKPPTKAPSQSPDNQPDWLVPEKPMEAPRLEVAESEMFFQLDGGYDWWTQHCQQSISSLPATQAGLDAVVFAAMQNSPIVKLINTEPQIAQTIVSESSANFDWATFVETTWADTDRAVVSLLDTGTAGGRFVEQQLLFEAGVRKNLYGGGQLRIGNAFQRTDNNSTFLSPPDQATSQLILDYRQPLMRGAGKQVNKSQIMLARIGNESAHSESQVRLQQFLVDVVSEYWELFHARGVLVQRMRSIERANELLKQMKMRVEAGDATEGSLFRIQAEIAARQSDLVQAQNQVAIRQETLLNLTHGSATGNFSDIEIVPTEAPGTFTLPYDLDVVTEIAVQNRAEVQVALAAIRASAIEKNLALNDLKPQLDAIVSTFVSGVAEQKHVGDAFTDSFNNDPSYAIGLSFEIPIGRRASKSRLHRQQLEFQRLQFQLQQTLGNIRLDARLAWRDVESFARELENHQTAAAHAARELEFVAARSENPDQGEPASSMLLVDDLLQSQARLAIAEEELLRSQTDLSIALVELKRATGQLLKAASIEQPSANAVQHASFEQIEGTAEVWQPPVSNAAPQPTGNQPRYDLETSTTSRSVNPLSGQLQSTVPRRAQRLPKKIR